MSLPAPVLDLAASVVPDAEERGKLAFAYAHGAVVSGFGGSDELGLVCVWNQPEIPGDAPGEATHVTQAWFDTLLAKVTAGDGWGEAADLPLADVAAFAYGVLLSDDDGAGTAARGTVSDFPDALATRAAEALSADLAAIPAQLADTGDHWLRAETLCRAVYRGYVAWFAAGGHYFPGLRRRREYATHFGLDEAVPKREQRIWETLDPQQLRDRYTDFASRILDDQ